MLQETQDYFGTGDSQDQGVVENELGQQDNVAEDTDQNSDEDESKATSFDYWKEKKGYKSPEELNKAHYHQEKHIGTLERENEKLRNWAMKAGPYVQWAAQQLAQKEGNNMETDQDKGQEPKQDTQQNMQPKAEASQSEEQVNKEMIEKMMKETFGSKFEEFNKRLTHKEVTDTLNHMRNDKKNFPYMNKDIEKDMVEALKMSGNSFPQNEQGLMVLYNAAVGKNLNKILSDNKAKTREEVMNNLDQKNGGFIEDDFQGSSGGNSKKAGDAIIDSIINAPYGKSQI